MHIINTISTIKIPLSLQNIPEPPAKIWCSGTMPDENRLHVAIVGTRKPTAYGRTVTEALASQLAERGVVIVSGLAHGVDSIAHKAVVGVRGQTIAVQANGLDAVYPASHRQLAESIVKQGGCLLSEYPPGTPPMQHRFLERNRLVSGLSQIIIVTEAGLRSGTTNTVSHALGQGKDVYVVPGPITSPMSAGCNALIAQGATPIVSIESFVDGICPLSVLSSKQLASYTAEEKLIIELIGGGVDDGQLLQQQSNLSPEVFSQTITLLEIRGVVHALGGNKWSL
jgi:DNA processing protein